MMTEIRFSGFGGQGVIRCGLITGKALSIFDNKFATLTQSFGPEARGGACSCQLVVSEKRVLYPYITNPDILVTMSQEAYTKYIGEIKKDGILIIEKDLVKINEKDIPDTVKVYGIPSTRIAEKLGHRIVANLVMLGYFTAVTKIVSEEAMKKAIPGLVPSNFIELNLIAFDKGYNYRKEEEKN